nr:hypothetical protein [Tanacetum cinerariifolium]
MSSQPKNQFEHVNDFDIDDSDIRPTTSLRLASIVQAVKIRKITYIMEGEQDCVMPTQDYIMKLIEDVDFTRGPWLSAVEYEGGIMTVTIKDHSGTISGIIHYKVLTECGFGNAITVKVALILKHVSVFSPKQSPHSLNIRMTNMVKVFPKDTVLGDRTGEHQMTLDQKALTHTLEEEARANEEWDDKLRQQPESDDEHEKRLFGFDF